MERLRFLLVEDHKELANAMREQIDREGHLVTTAPSADFAVRLASISTFDVVLCDIRLPDANGFDLVPRLRRLQGDGLIAIATSGSSSPADFQRSREAGFVDFLPKPVYLDVLFECIERCRKARSQAEWIGLTPKANDPAK